MQHADDVFRALCARTASAEHSSRRLRALVEGHLIDMSEPRTPPPALLKMSYLVNKRKYAKLDKYMDEMTKEEFQEAFDYCLMN